MQTSSIKPTAAPNLIACGRCAAEFPPRPGAQMHHCPQCGAAHAAVAINTLHYHCLIFAMIEEDADEVHRALHEREMEVRTLILEIEQQRMAMHRLVSEAECTAVMLRQSFWGLDGSMVAVVGWSLLLIVLAQIRGGLGTCLLLPVMVWAAYQLVQAFRRVQSEQRDRLETAKSLLAAKEREIDLYAQHVAALEDRLFSYVEAT